MAGNPDTLMKFPCRFPIKAMGRAEENFDVLVVGIIRKHSPEIADSFIRTRYSRDGRYVSITVTIDAKSRRQLDDIYRELTANERVLIAL